MSIAALLTPDRIVLDLTVRGKDALLRALGQIAAQRGAPLPAEAITEALARREQLGSTGLGGGFALPHALFAELDTPLAVLVRLARPIPFDAIDEAPVDLACLLLSPAGGTAHVLTLAALSRLFRRPDTRRLVRAAPDAARVLAALGGTDGPESARPAD